MSAIQVQKAVTQSGMHIQATQRKVTAVVPDKVKTPEALAAKAEHQASQVGKRRKKNKQARQSRRANR